MKPSLGKFLDAPGAAVINLRRLLETRMLIQANSGGGKSWAIRRLLEQTAGHVQQLVIDPEGEFATLREKHDYVIAAPHDGDALAHPRTAQILARRLLETGVSSILDIYDLKAHERHAFVRIFCETLVNAPKALWQPCLIVLDEAHTFCPEAGKAESAAAVIDLATRGRKRGYALIAATQRLAKLHKDAAAELLNKLVGRTGLDVDVKRAADELGMTPRDAMEKLRPLLPGEFFVFGPALSLTVQKLKVGPVETTHPKAGQRTLRAPPKPTEAIKAVLPKLADLPKEAEEEARSLADLRKELAAVKRELTQATHAKPGVSREDLKSAEQRGYERAAAQSQAAEARGYERAAKEAQREFAARVKTLKGELHQALERAIAGTGSHALVRAAAPERKPQASTPVKTPVITGSKPGPAPVPPRIASGNGADELSKAQQKLLDKLLWLEQHDLHPVRKEMLAAVAGVNPTSGGYFNNLGTLRTAGLIDYPARGEVGFTDAGRALAQPSDDPRPIHEHWLDIVTASQRAILEALIARHPEAIEKGALAELLNVSPTSGGYFNNLGRLRTLGAVDYPQPGQVALTRHVMP